MQVLFLNEISREACNEIRGWVIEVTLGNQWVLQARRSHKAIHFADAG
jgi:hypothetical protein